MNSHPENKWTLDDSRQLYHINRWGTGYFEIDETGCVVARPQPENGATVRLTDVVAEAANRGLKTPLLIRFQDILRHRVEKIHNAFLHAMERMEFRGSYRGVFPIKVNQLREVVEEILDASRSFRHGLEVGTKPELFAALAMMEGNDSLLVCNGHKDASYIRMALLGQKVGKTVVIVIEKLKELEQVVSITKTMDLRPVLGIRMRLWSRTDGKWAKSGGESAKFGLSTSELLLALAKLKEHGLTDCLRMLHFHIGSQVPDIVTVKKAVQEAARYYAKLHVMGFQIQWFDVGGGLGVDYDGSRSKSNSSTNYSLQEYANDVVYHLGEICNAEGVPHPEIVTESGRATVAHHSVLVVETFEAVSKSARKTPFQYGADEHNFVEELLKIRDNLDTLSKMEAWHDAQEHKEAAQSMFNLGILGLEEKAKIESLYWEISRRVVDEFKDREHVPEEIHHLKENLCDQFLCNFSVFQSLIDHWALGQIFPIMPLQRLDESPQREATLADITCDSDGQVARFIDPEGPRDTLRLHAHSNNGKPFFLGLFLMGAYQDTMGDMHNLFGRVNEAHVFLDPDEPLGYYIEETIEGTTSAQVLTMVQYDEKALVRSVKKQIDAAIRSDRIKPSEGMRLLSDYTRGLGDQTYLSF